MEKYSFFNDVNNDRIYYAEDFARHLAVYFTNGIFNNGCQVLGNNNDMSVNVSIGSANINGYRYDNDSVKKLEIDNADGVLSRIDNVVIRFDLTNRMITTQIIKGTFADNPSAPSLVRNSTIYDLRIAQISIPAGTTAITQDLITDTRYITSDCGDVISTVETPDTENLFLQMQAKFEEQYNQFNEDLDNLELSFNTWFRTIKNKLDGDTAGKLTNDIVSVVNASLKSFTMTLSVTNWVKNETTNEYEYDVSNTEITANHEVKANMDLINQEIAGNGYTKSYSGGFKMILADKPSSDLSVTFTYQLANLSLEVE